MAQILSNPECKWELETKARMAKVNITPEELVGSKYQTKATIKKAILISFKKNLDEATEGKSKMEYFLEYKRDWQPGKRAKYMNELTRKQTSLIFKARARMLKVKGNYKNGHPNQTCRMCKSEGETQKTYPGGMSCHPPG